MRTIETPAARAYDPPTSHEAAEYHTASGRRASEQQQVLRAMIAHGQRGVTSDELAQRASLDRYMVARRLPELRSAGHVFVRGFPLSPEKRPSSISKRAGMVWRPVSCQAELPL